MAGPVPKPTAIELCAAMVLDRKITAQLPLQLCKFLLDSNDDKKHEMCFVFFFLMALW